MVVWERLVPVKLFTARAAVSKKSLVTFKFFSASSVAELSSSGKSYRAAAATQETKARSSAARSDSSSILYCGELKESWGLALLGFEKNTSTLLRMASSAAV